MKAGVQAATISSHMAEAAPGDPPPDISYGPVNGALGVPITPVGPTNSGGPITGFAVVGTALPTGLSVHPTNGAIFGTPATHLSPAEPRTIRATGPGGTDDAMFMVEIAP